LEVMNPDELSRELLAFVQKNQVGASPLVIVLSPAVYFDKVYPGTIPPTGDEMQKFVDKVPFSSVSSKLFKIQKGFRLVIINRDFYEAIHASFESAGFNILAVVPGFVLEPLGVKSDFDAQACHLVLKRLDLVMANSFISPDDSQSIHGKEQAFLKKYSFSIAIVSIALVAFSITMIITTLKRRSTPTQASPSRVIPTSAILQPTLVPTTLPTPNLSQYKIQIINGSGVPGQASSLESQLRPLGFTQITTGNAPTQITGKAQVTFSSAVPPTAREQVLGILNPLYPGLGIKEDPQAKFDIVITLAKTTP